MKRTHVIFGPPTVSDGPLKVRALFHVDTCGYILDVIRGRTLLRGDNFYWITLPISLEDAIPLFLSGTLGPVSGTGTVKKETT